MTTNEPSDGALASTYREWIGDPSTPDEVRGYWVFVVGLVMGVVGIGLFAIGAADPMLRLVSIVIAAAGLVLLVAGPVIRLPLRPMANWFVYAGMALAALALVWFVMATTGGNWDPVTGRMMIIWLYAAGLLAIGIGAVGIPILTDRAELEARLSALDTELEELRSTLADSKADEADLASVVGDLRSALADTSADEMDLASVVNRLRQTVADTEADEMDLAERLQVLRESQSQFELYEDAGEEWRWRLRHRNRNIVATSGEGYTARHNALKGMQAVRRDALGADVLTFDDPDELPEEDEELTASAGPESSQAEFERYEDNAGEWRWRLRHENGNIIADGGEGYADLDAVESAIERIKAYAGPAQYLRPDPTAFGIYRDAAGEWRWRLVHRNGNVLGVSGEGYATRRGARRAVDTLREDIQDLEFEVYEDTAGQHRFRIFAANGQNVGSGGEGFVSERNANDAVDRIQQYAPEADVLDVGEAAFEVYEDQAGESRWRLRHRNGNILGDSGQGYADRSGAWNGIESVKRNAPGADVVEPDEE